MSIEFANLRYFVTGCNVLQTSINLWLNSRQIKATGKEITAVPEEAKTILTLEEHKAAAEYEK